jgi:pimeloyl-ACP methyl ester carboxylesterase
MRETAAVIGDSTPLVGVVADPEVREPLTDRPTVLFLNAGLIHRVGPNRLHVTLARRLATTGFASLRFDFSGIGDSPPRRDDAKREVVVLRDARSAMEFLERTRGAKKFILIGLCQGAHMAFEISCKDPRVVGVVMIDPNVSRTMGYHVRRVLRGIRRARSWKSLIGTLGERAKKVLTASRRGAPDGLDDPYAEDPDQMPSKETVLAELQTLLGRGTRCLFIFTERGMQHYYNHEQQIFEIFPELRGHRNVEVAFMRGTDHTFTLLHHQAAVVDVIERWARSFDAESRRPPAVPVAANGNGSHMTGRSHRSRRA